MTRAPGSSSVEERTTVVDPPTNAVCTPDSVVIAVSSPSAHFHTWSSVASPIGLAWKWMASAVASITPRSCRSTGVTGSPSINRRRAPSRSPAVTRRPSGSRRGQAGDEIDPRVVVVVGGDVGPAGRRVDAQRHRPALVARDHRHEQTRPRSSRRWRRRGRTRDPTRHRPVSHRGPGRARVTIGVVGAGGRITNGASRCTRHRRIGDHPFRHRCLVDAAGHDRFPVGAPPVAPVPAHLLGGDEVRAAPRHRRSVVGTVAGEYPRRAVQLAEAQRRTAHVGEAARRRDRAVDRTPAPRRRAGGPGPTRVRR